MKEALCLLVILLGFTAIGMFWSDMLVTLPDQEAEVEVVALCFDNPNHKNTNHVLVKWNGKVIRAECSPFKAGGLKAGDMVTVEVRKGWLLNSRRPPQVKED